MRTWSSLAFAAAAALLALPSIASADIDSVDTNEGTIGTEIVITGSGFGEGRPRAFLVPVVANKRAPARYPLRVTDFSDTSVTCQVIKGVAGDYDIQLFPRVRGADPFTNMDAFEIMAPSVGDSDTRAEPGDEIVINGEFFSTKRPRVRIGGKIARVLKGWTDTVITCIVPRRIANGLYSLEVRSRAGTTTEDDFFTVFGSTVGAIRRNTMTCKIGSAAFRARADFSGGAGSPGMIVLAANQRSGILQLRSLSVTIPAVSADELPVTFTNSQVLVTYTQAPKDLLTANSQGQSFTVTVAGAVGDRIYGTFSGTLKDLLGNDTFQVTNGKFSFEVVGGLLVAK